MTNVIWAELKKTLFFSTIVLVGTLVVPRVVDKETHMELGHKFSRKAV